MALSAALRALRCVGCGRHLRCLSSSGLRLNGKKALVTGGGGGLGAGISKLFGQHGASVAVVDLSLDMACEVADNIPNAIALQCDVANEEQVETTVATAIEQLGGLDILVNNAGIQHISSVTDFTLEAWRRILAVHLDGAFLFTRAALRHMYITETKGKLIFMGSVHSKLASTQKCAYVAAKHGLLGFMRAVAKEAGPKGIAANLICPGYVMTPLVAGQIPAQAEQRGMTERQVIEEVFLKDTVDFEFSSIEDVAEVALGLAAHPTNALTGQSVIVSHGWCME